MSELIVRVSKGPISPRQSRKLARRTAVAFVLSTAAASWVALGTEQALAQTTPARDGEFSVQRFTPAPGPRNFITTRGARTDGEMAWSFGLVGSYGLKPFTVRSCKSDTNCSDPNRNAPTDVLVVENIVAADIMGSLTPVPFLQLGLRIPGMWVKGQGLNDQGGADLKGGGINTVGLGDPELEAKLRVVGEPKDPFVGGVALFGTAPLGNLTAEGGYIGDETPTVGLRGIVDLQLDVLSIGANLAGVYRGEGRVGSTALGSEFRYGIAAAFRASPVFRFMADGFGATDFSFLRGSNTMEVDAGAEFSPLNSSLAFSLGAGAGVIEGIGVPQMRAFLGFSYVSEQRDDDKDGLADDVDQCPTEAEDKDGYDDGDGCPDVDNDEDSIEDAVDKCPMKAEDPDGFEDTDGCPEEDNDKDGVLDHNDRCPKEKETKNGFEDEDGCPDVPDADGDGVRNPDDKCVNEAEDTDGFQDTDGCPDPDNDADGVPDAKDECGEEPETVNGFEDEDGCPDTAPKRRR